jgi:hypothetical protein
MGLRSWLTPVSNKKEWLEVKKSIEDNPAANGIHYVLRVTDKNNRTPFKEGDVVVAWSGDGNSSLNDLKPKRLQRESYFLDSFIDDICPEFHDEPGGPGKYGTFLENDKQVEEAF